jgi:hypothetical protein
MHYNTRGLHLPSRVVFKDLNVYLKSYVTNCPFEDNQVQFKILRWKWKTFDESYILWYSYVDLVKFLGSNELSK